MGVKCPSEHQNSKGRSLEIVVIFLTKRLHGGTSKFSQGKMDSNIAFSALYPRGRATDRERTGATVVVYTFCSLQVPMSFPDQLHCGSECWRAVVWKRGAIYRSTETTRAMAEESLRFHIASAESQMSLQTSQKNRQKNRRKLASA